MKEKEFWLGWGVGVALLIFFFSILFLSVKCRKNRRFSFGDKIAVVEVKGRSPNLQEY